MTIKNERDARIASLQAELDFLRSENHKDHEKAVELADMIANAHDVSRIRVNHSRGDVYILFAGENPNERLSFKLDRNTAGSFTCAMDDTLQEMDEEPTPVATEQEKKENTEYVFAHPEIQKLLSNLFGTPKNEQSA